MTNQKKLSSLRLTAGKLLVFLAWVGILALPSPLISPCFIQKSFWNEKSKGPESYRSLILSSRLLGMAANVSDSNLNQTNFYAGLLEWDNFMVIYIVFHAAMTFVGPGW